MKTVKGRVIPLYLKRDDPYWLEVAESLLLVFREGVGMTRGDVHGEIDAIFGEGVQTLAHRGLAKVLEDRSEFEVVADVPPEDVRRKVFSLAALYRQKVRQEPLTHGHRPPFRREAVLEAASRELGIETGRLFASLFADLKDENRMIAFQDLSAQRLLDRYNVALAQAVLLRSTSVRLEVRNETPARYRQLFRWLKFHRLLYQVSGTMADGYQFQIDGPLSLFSSTSKYGVQIALFLPALLLCRTYRLDAELRWGPQRSLGWLHLESSDGIVSHYQDASTYSPPEMAAFLERLRQLAPQWQVSEMTEILPLGSEGVWVPDYKFIHQPTGLEVFVEVLGFWKRASVERLLELLPKHGPPRYMLAISERLKVDEDTSSSLQGPLLRFKDIPNAPDFLELLNGFLPTNDLLPAV